VLSAGRAPHLGAYFLFRIPNTLWPLVFDIRSDAYFYSYIFTLPAALVFYILLVMELYRLVLEQYKGLHSVGKWAMYASVAGAVTISILTLIPKITPSMPQKSTAIGLVMVSERGVYTALAVFIILLLLLLSFFPIQLRRNVRVPPFWHENLVRLSVLAGNDTWRQKADQLAPFLIKRPNDAESVLPTRCVGHGRTLPSRCCPACWSKRQRC